MQVKIQTMVKKSDCGKAAVRAHKNGKNFQWGNDYYRVDKVAPRGEKEIAVHLVRVPRFNQV